MQGFRTILVDGAGAPVRRRRGGRPATSSATSTRSRTPSTTCSRRSPTAASRRRTSWTACASSGCSRPSSAPQQRGLAEGLSAGPGLPGPRPPPAAVAAAAPAALRLQGVPLPARGILHHTRDHEGSIMKIGVFTVLFGDQAARGNAGLPGRGGRRGGRDRHRRVSGQRALRPGRAASSVEAGRVPRGDRRARAGASARCPATATRCTRESEIAARARRGVPKTLELASRLGVRTRHHVQRLPGRRAGRDAAELDRLALAAGVRARCSSGSGASGSMPYWTDAARPPAGRVRGGHRDAPELRRLQPGDDAAAARDRAET